MKWVVENYLSTVQTQEFLTKYLKNKGARDSGITPNCTKNVLVC